MTSTSSKVLLTRRALILGAIETTYNTNPGLSGDTDAALVESPDYKVTPQVLKRNFVQDTLSPLGSRVGRKIASLSFGMELRSNGLTNSGALADECMVGRFMRACAYEASTMTGGAAAIVKEPTTNTNDPTWAGGGTSVLTNKSKYRATVVLGGNSATAKIRLTGGVFHDTAETTYFPEEGVSASVGGTTPTMTLAVVQTTPLAPTITVGGTFESTDILNVTVCGVDFSYTVIGGDTDLAGAATSLAALINAHALITASAVGAVITLGYASTGAGVVVTSGVTALNVGAQTGLTLTPTFSGALTLGDYWDVYVYPQGILYLPRSEDFESISLEAYFDGVKHEITGCFGTFTIEADAGSYGMIKFTFTGQYHAPTDTAVPDSVQEETIPPVVESAQLILGDGGAFQPVVAKFTFDQANQVAERPDVNSTDGYAGTRITGREPKGGIDPEATLVADYDFWGLLASSEQTALTMRIGSTAGNRILFNAPKIIYTGLTYADRNGIRTLDAGIEFVRDAGDDETEFVFA